MKSIGVIGAGNMGSAIIAGIHDKYTVYVCEQDQSHCRDLRHTHNVFIAGLKAVVEKSQAIIIAVKPQDFDAILSEVREVVTKDKLVISIAAGITCQYIEKRLGQEIRVVRTMPNLPVKVGEGMTAICRGRKATNSDLGVASQIFDSIGKSVIVEEKWMDAITAVSGSGPAYVFLFVEYLNKAAKSLGLKENVGHELVLQTLKGSLKLLEQSKEDASVLRAKVTSKKGTTQAALEVFSKKKTDKIFVEALKAAKQRAKELSQA